MAQQYSVDVVVKATGLGDVQRLERSVKGLTAEQAKVTRASEKAANGVRRFDRAAAGAGKSAQDAVGGIKAMGAAINAAMGKIALIIGTFKGFQAATSAAFERGVAEKRFKNLTGSTEEYTAALQAAKDISEKFTITQTTATKALGDVYARLSGLGFGLKEVTEIYAGFNKIARENGVAQQEAAGAFFQLSQALGSGKLHGDELRSILERMPQLAQLIAQEMGVTAGQIRQMGQEGKITAEVMYNTLARAAQGAGDLSAKLTPAQLAMMQFQRATEQLSVAFGQVLLPVLTPVMQGVAMLFQEIQKFVTQIQPVFAAVGGLANQFAVLSGASADAASTFKVQMIPVVGTLYEMFSTLNNVVGWFTQQWGKLTGNEEMARSAKETAEATKVLEDNARAALDQFTGMPPTVAKTKTEAQQLAASTKAIAAAQNEANQAGQQALAAIGRQQSVKQALLGAEQQITDAKLQSAQADLEAASTQSEKIAAASQIYELTKQQAELQYQSTVATAEAETLKAEAALKTAEALQRQVKAEVELQRLKKVQNKQQETALQAAAKGVEAAQKQLTAQNQITAAITEGAAATRDAQMAAAEVVLEQQKSKTAQDAVTASINQSTEAMGRLANKAQQAATASKGIGGGALGGRGSTFSYGGGVPDKYKLDENGNIVERSSEERRRDAMQQKLAMMNQMSGAAEAFDYMYSGSDYGAMAHSVSQIGGMLGPVGSQLYNEYVSTWGSNSGHPKSIQDALSGREYLFNNRYAEGGYVTGPQQALVGEGGEPEYIIPESKMDQAMARYGAGQRGDSVIPSSATVNVNYSGSTVSMGGEDYIKKGDVPGLLNSAVGQTLKTLRRNSNSRLYAGFGR